MKTLPRSQPFIARRNKVSGNPSYSNSFFRMAGKILTPGNHASLDAREIAPDRAERESRLLQ